MVSKKHEIIVYCLLVASMLALVSVSLSFKYNNTGETFLFEADLDINVGETVTYNGSLFDVPQHIYLITISQVKAKIDPLLNASVRIIINENFTGAAKGPEDFLYYNEAYAGKIEELAFTDAGLGVTFHMEIRAVVDMNPFYMSLSIVCCVLVVYYLYIVDKKKKGKPVKIDDSDEKLAK